MANPFFKEDYLRQIFDKRLAKSRSKGLDKISALDAKNKNLLDFKLISRKCKGGTYKFTPYLELLKVKRRNTLPRMISIPSIRDKVVLLSLKEFLHSKFSNRVKRRLPNSFIREVKNYISKHENHDIFFLKLDIQNFFGEIRHDYLFDEITQKSIPKYIQRLIQIAISNPKVPAGYSKRRLIDYSNKTGIPQGLSISNILAEIYLTQLDNLFLSRNYLYVRYVDDIFILMKSNRIFQIEQSIKSKLAAYSLPINIEKTIKGKLLTHNGISFLGYEVFKHKTSINSDNFHKIVSRITDKISWLKKCLQEPSYRPTWISDENRLREVFTEEVNERITGAKKDTLNYGWLFYFIESTDIDQLFKLDYIVRSLIEKSNTFLRPPKVKRFVRAYYEIKYNNGGSYILDYDNISTFKQKRDFLVLRGKINPTGVYSDPEIEMIYDNTVRKNISHLEKDVNYSYF